MKEKEATRGTKWKGVKPQKAKIKENKARKGTKWKEIQPQKAKNEEKITPLKADSKWNWFKHYQCQVLVNREKANNGN